MSGLFWPEAQAGDALVALAGRCGLHVGGPLPPPPPGLDAGRPEELGAWLAQLAARLGPEIDVEGVAVRHAEIAAFLDRAGPALLAVPGQGLLALVRGGGAAAVLAPDLAVRRVPEAWLRQVLAAPLEGPARTEVAALLQRAGLAGRTGAARRLLSQRLGGARLQGAWLLRLPPGAAAGRHLRHEGGGRRLLRLLLAGTLERAGLLLALLLLGRGVLTARLDSGWLSGCLLLLLTAMPLRLWQAWEEEALARLAGVVLRRRLLSAALGLPAAGARGQGIGRFLGIALEAESLEWLATAGGLGLLLALPELLLAAALLALSPQGPWLVGLLLGFLGAGLLLARRHYRRQRAWVAARLDLSGPLIEDLIGNRTRLAQQPPARWHEAEDQRVARYLAAWRRRDRSGAPLFDLAGAAFTVAGLLVLLPAMAAGQAAVAALALGLWAVLLGAQALEQVGQGLELLSGAWLAYEEVAPLLAAAAPETGTSPPVPQAPGGVGPAPGGEVVLRAEGLRYRHGRGGAAVLDGTALSISRGDRLLLEGPSGGGKSTLCAVLAGQRAPEAGLLLLRGLDPGTLGLPAWRRRVALAPQYHENHVLSGTLAFNLLMGRAWPPGPADLAEAAALCEELGLAPLIARMPAGLAQMVGETGWQLSQGERSRVFLARALLQGAEVVLLDESLAALDPETLAQVGRCLARRREALLVVAHP